MTGPSTVATSSSPQPTSATPSTPPAEPDPEIALIAETLRGYRDELRDVRTQMLAAEERHRQEMAEAEARHQAAMSDVRAALEQSERTRLRLEAMVDVMTGRQSHPPQPHPPQAPGQGPPPPRRP